MIRTVVTRLISGLVLTGVAMAAAMAADGGLRQFGWNNRVVLVISSPGSALADEQRRQVLSDPSALDERDMVVLSVSGDTVTTLHGKAVDADAAVLRRDAGVAPDAAFAVILIGKDGGIKLRSEKLVSSADLFGLIDSMPMRAREAKP